MKTVRRGTIGFIIILGMMMASGCAFIKIGDETMMAYREAKDAFQRATLANAKKCAPCQYATAEAYLAWADHEVLERDSWGHIDLAIPIVREKSLEAIRICEKPPAAKRPLRILDSVLPPGTVGKPYSHTLKGEGGTPPYEWSVESGALPPGLGLDKGTGTISGTPTRPTP
jgi:hypothetical protein